VAISGCYGIFFQGAGKLKTKDLNRSQTNENISDKLLSLLISRVQDYAIFMVDPQGFILTWNKGAEKIKGYREAEILGKHISIFYTADDIRTNQPAENLREALAVGSVEREGWRVRKDGSKFWANIVFTAIYNDDGQLQGFAKITRNMTQWKAADERKEQQKTELEQRVIQSTDTIIKNETRYQALVESIDDGIAMFDKNFKPIYRSRSAERISGWSNEEFLSNQLPDLIHPEDKPAAHQIFDGVIDNPGVPAQFTYRVMHKDGAYMWLAGTFTNMLNDEAINAIVCNFRNVTERKIAEQELRRTVGELSDYKYALDQASIVAITDQRGVIKHVNPNFCKISHYTAAELIGQDHRIVNSGYHDKAFIKNIWKTIANGQIWRGELRNKAKDGSIYWVDATIVPFLDDKGKPYQYLAIRSDITDRKLAEALVKSKNEQIEDILERITDGFMTLDSDLRFTYVNKRLGEMTGHSPGSIIGKYIWDVFPAATTAVREGFARALREQCYLSFEDYYEPLDLWAEDRLYPSEGGVSAFIRDISARKRAEREIWLLNEGLEQKVAERTLQLEAANKELEAFSYSVSHDLRTPLRAIGGFAMMLKDDHETMSPADRNRVVATISNNASLMGQLIDDLLEFSRLGRKELKFNNVDMQAMVRGCISELTYGVDKIYDFKIRELPACEADCNMIKQVWMNLLANALKYASKIDKPVIEVGATAETNRITFYIKDNGVGFDMKYADKLFGVFQRLHRKDEFEGTGVGLALVKRVIDRHQGSVWAVAKPGKGAAFYFSLPVTQVSS